MTDEEATEGGSDVDPSGDINPPADVDSSGDVDPPADVNAPAEVDIERATARDELDVRRILDAAMLQVDDALGERIEAGDVFIARFRPSGTVIGAVVSARPEPTRRHVDALAVRRARRGRGIGTALIAATIRDSTSDPAVHRLSAAFDPSLRSFYTDLGFDVRPDPSADDRLLGVRSVGNQ